MQKEPMTTTETSLPEIKRRKRKVPESVHAMEILAIEVYMNCIFSSMFRCVKIKVTMKS